MSLSLFPRIFFSASKTSIDLLDVNYTKKFANLFIHSQAITQVVVYAAEEMATKSSPICWAAVAKRAYEIRLELWIGVNVINDIGDRTWSAVFDALLEVIKRLSGVRAGQGPQRTDVL